jgi:hypothetical protein
MAYRNLPAALQQNIRSYFHYKKQHNMYGSRVRNIYHFYHHKHLY